MVDTRNTIGVSFPRRTGLKLNQIINVSKEPAVVGDSLIFNARGEWEPGSSLPGTNSITNAMLQDNIIGNAEMQDNSVGNAEMQDNAIGTNEIVNLSVTAGKIANNTITSSQMAAGAATDTVIGNRTVTDTTVPSVDANTLTILLSNLANRIKALSGEAGWKTTPAVTVASHVANVANPHNTTHSQIGTIVAADLGAGAATDTVIGNRTITDTVVPSTDTNTLTTLLSNIGNIIKGITGAATWRTAPAATIASLKTTTDTQTTNITTNTGSISTNATTMNNHIANTSNPHSTTIGQIGLNPATVVNTATQSVTNVISDITGLTLTLANVGTYLVTLTSSITVDQGAGIHQIFLNLAGADGNAATFENPNSAATQRTTVTVTRLLTTSVTNTVVKGRINSATTGTSSVLNARTYLTAVQVA